MQVSVIVATLEGCRFDDLDDPARIERALLEAIRVGGFTKLHHHVHRFEPQGVTAAAVLSESHIALHSWPEHGLLFVDLATCSGAAATQAAFDVLRAAFPHTDVWRRDHEYSNDRLVPPFHPRLGERMLPADPRPPRPSH